MPFTAIEKNTGHRVNLLRIKHPHAELKAGEYICEICKEPMMIRGGPVIQAHFAHYPDNHSRCPDREKETPEHLLAKIEIADALRDGLSEYIDAQIEEEVWIEEIKRRADVLVIFPMGWRIAHEIQLAYITTEELEARTDDYYRAGVDVVWWFGRAADTESNRRWSLKKFGYSLGLDIETQDKFGRASLKEILRR